MTVSPELPVAYLPGASGRAEVWRPIADRLSRRRPPVLVDYPDPSVVPSAPGMLRELGEHVATRLPARCDVVALSMGCAVALHLALEHPEKVRALVLVTIAAGVNVVGLGGLDYREPFRRVHPTAPAWSTTRVDFSRRLGEIVAPTLVVVGDRDPIAPVSAAKFVAAGIPGARLEVIEGATHDLEEEFPDLLASLMEAHLRKAPA